MKVWRTWVCGPLAVLCGLVATSAAPLAQATVAETASDAPKVQYLGDATGTVFTFTATNGRTASESIGSVQITRPSAAWTVTACPSAPVGWTHAKGVSACTYDSAAGTGDNIAPYAVAKFKLKATTAAGSADVSGVAWTVSVNQSDVYSPTGAVAATAATA